MELLSCVKHSDSSPVKKLLCAIAREIGIPQRLLQGRIKVEEEEP